MRDVLVLTGPTASGKSGLALRLAERIGGEIVSADSRQVYRGMDIGTAKPTAAERRAVPHHGLDLVDPDARYSAGRFGRDARAWIERIRRAGRVPVVVGGTGFFIRSLLEPLFEEPPLDPARRVALEAELAARPRTELLAWLDRLDPEAARRLRGGGGTQRLKRALEVALLTGRPLSWWHRNAPAREPGVAAAVFVLRRPRETLDRRIDERVLDMIERGLVDEVRVLFEAGFARDDPGMSAVGYREIAAHLAGAVSLEQAVSQIQRATRQYARRQATWFRNQLPPDARGLDAAAGADALVEEVATEWRTRAGQAPPRVEDQGVGGGTRR